ncbi:MAG: PHP domain-containing protein [Oscillospiraceae bacterium]|jgi:histidinol-phosphatase (PHP family)|nr:PHP domain-containing protein [Oscillospiraceae bacterium]
MYDYHVHSTRSADGMSLPEEHIARAQALGLAGLCLTEHWESQPESPAWRPDFAQFAPTHSLAALGVELGTPQADPTAARAALASAPFDFVLGSVHYEPNQPDYYYRSDVSSFEDARTLLRGYVEAHFGLLEFGDFDSVAHLGYPLRYIHTPGVTMLSVRDELEPLLRALASAGKAIECNTSGIGRAWGAMASLELLTLWRECGGELVTLGSDAHNASRLGCALRAGAELLRTADFERYAVFSNRRPMLMNLST